MSYFQLLYDAGGNESIHKVTRFTPCEFRQIYSTTNSEIKSKWNVGRSHQSAHNPMDALCMLLLLLKHSSSWNHVGNMLGISGLTFMCIVTGFKKK